MIEHVEIPGADGVRIHAALSGDRGPLMVFLHGFPEYWRAWQREMVEFGADWRVLVPDLRGYNRSEKPSRVRDYALAKVARDVAALIEHFSPGRPAIVVGHDWGGLTAWLLARDHASLLERLVIINAPHPVLFGRELRRSLRQCLASGYVLAFQARGLAEVALRAGRCALLRGMVFGTSSRSDCFSADERRGYLEAWNRPGALRGGLNYYRCWENIRLLFESPDSWRIRTPTLVLWGERDPALRPGNLEGLEKLVPQVIVRRHPTATHWIVHEDPAWVHEQIRRFLE